MLHPICPNFLSPSTLYCQMTYKSFKKVLNKKLGLVGVCLWTYITGERGSSSYESSMVWSLWGKSVFFKHLLIMPCLYRYWDLHAAIFTSFLIKGMCDVALVPIEVKNTLIVFWGGFSGLLCQLVPHTLGHPFQIQLFIQRGLYWHANWYLSRLSQSNFMLEWLLYDCCRPEDNACIRIPWKIK